MYHWNNLWSINILLNFMKVSQCQCWTNYYLQRAFTHTRMQAMHHSHSNWIRQKIRYGNTTMLIQLKFPGCSLRATCASFINIFVNTWQAMILSRCQINGKNHFLAFVWTNDNAEYFKIFWKCKAPFCHFKVKLGVLLLFVISL